MWQITHTIINHGVGIHFFGDLRIYNHLSVWTTSLPMTHQDFLYRKRVSLVFFVLFLEGVCQLIGQSWNTCYIPVAFLMALKLTGLKQKKLFIRASTSILILMSCSLSLVAMPQNWPIFGLVSLWAQTELSELFSQNRLISIVIKRQNFPRQEIRDTLY